MRKRAFLLFLPCVFGILAGKCLCNQDSLLGGDDSSSISIQALFPIDPGIKWRYERTSSEGDSHYVTHVKGAASIGDRVYYILANPFGVSYYELTPEMLVLKGIAPSEEPENVSFYEEGKMIRLKTPLRKGTRWEDKATLILTDTTILSSYRTEIRGWEKVDVPAGTFDAIVTSSTLNTAFIDSKSELGKGAITMEQVWYSPGTGVVRRANYLIYGKDQTIPVRDDKLEEFTREGQNKIK